MPSEGQVEQTDALVKSSLGIQAEATALGDVAADVRSEGTPMAAYEAEQIESMSPEPSRGIRGNVYEARMMYPGLPG